MHTYIVWSTYYTMHIEFELCQHGYVTSFQKNKPYNKPFMKANTVGGIEV